MKKQMEHRNTEKNTSEPKITISFVIKNSTLENQHMLF
jgi:hypothetical protein